MLVCVSPASLFVCLFHLLKLGCSLRLFLLTDLNCQPATQLMQLTNQVLLLLASCTKGLSPGV